MERYSIAKNCFSDVPKGDDGSALLIFYGMCNIRCPYCYNVRNFPKWTLSKEDVEKAIKENCDKFIKNEWLILTGGESLIQHKDNISSFINLSKSLGMKVGLYTNGTLPKTLCQYLSRLDYVSIDYKNTIDWYGDSQKEFIETLMIVNELYNKNLIKAELKTTLVKQWHSKEVLISMKNFLKEKNINIPWIFQEFTDMKGQAVCYDKSFTYENSFLEKSFAETILFNK